MGIIELKEGVAQKRHTCDCTLCCKPIKKGCRFRSIKVSDCGELYLIKLCSKCMYWEDKYFRETKAHYWENDDLSTFRNDVLTDYLDFRKRRVFKQANRIIKSSLTLEKEKL